jgi:glutamine amidotransferase
VIVASERMDADPGWRLLHSGELIEVGPDLAVHSSPISPGVPRFPLSLADLGEHEAASQHPDRDPGVPAR